VMGYAKKHRLTRKRGRKAPQYLVKE
jgi:hypothetical protein